MATNRKRKRHAARSVSTDAELAPRNTNFQRLLESVDGIVWEADYPFRLRFVSPQVERILGYPAERWMDDSSFWQRHIHVDDRDRVISEREAAIRVAGHHLVEYRFHSARDGIVWLRDSLLATRDAQGQVCLQGLVVNITALKQAEAELRLANSKLARQTKEHQRHLQQTVESMETFCYGIAHELRAPVRAMQGFSELLVNDPAHPKAADYLARIAGSAARMDRLITDLLAYGRLHHAELLLVPADVSNVIERAVAALTPQISDARAEVNVLPTTARVVGNPMLLIQALQNLISNALKFVSPGTRPRVEIHARRVDDNYVRISVCDNGIGINPDYADKVFGIFQRCHTAEEYPGTGVGLALVKRIAELLNGRVGLDRTVCEGSCFWLELPVA